MGGRRLLGRHRLRYRSRAKATSPAQTQLGQTRPTRCLDPTRCTERATCRLSQWSGTHPQEGSSPSPCTLTKTESPSPFNHFAVAHRLERCASFQDSLLLVQSFHILSL